MKTPLCLLCLFFVLVFPLRRIDAVGPRAVTASGNAVRWPSMPVTVHLETDLEVDTKDVEPLVNEALDTWADLDESDVMIAKASLGAAVDDSNVCDFVFDTAACPGGPINDGTNPLIIDEDGSITADFFGAANKFTTLGFAAIIAFHTETGDAVKGEAVFNAACLNTVEEPGCVIGPFSFSDDDFISFIVHELGHFLGLDHSQVNLIEATDLDPANDDLITTMFPTFIPGNGADFKTPERDDRVGLAQLYPSETFASTTWSITGQVFDEDGETGIQCVNLVARNVDSPKLDAISALTGDFAPAGEENNGDYEIPGLTPGVIYSLAIEPIPGNFKGASGYTPCRGSNGEPPPPSAVPAMTSSDSYTEAAGETLKVNATLGGDFVVSDGGTGGCSLIR